MEPFDVAVALGMVVGSAPVGDAQLAKSFDITRRSERCRWLREVTYYVLFFIQLESRKVCLGVAPHLLHPLLVRMRRNTVSMEKWGFLADSRYLLHDRGTKFCPSFRQLIEAGKSEGDGTASEESESERLRGALGEIGEAGMPVEGSSASRRTAAHGYR
jgi:hypothetical protein